MTERSWREAVEEEWKRRHAGGVSSAGGGAYRFPLIAQSFDEREIVAVVDTLLSGRLTMADRVREFEQRFAQIVGARYAVMVHSGSSANLLAVAAARNPARARRWQVGDEVLIPAVCWSTSLAPLVQLGLKPVFVDADPETLNMDLADARRRLTPRTRGIMAVHILGNSAPMTDLMALARERDLIVIEDTCESLGSRALGRMLGAHGDFGTYSFYYSHHITTGEGGAIVCDSPEDYDLLRCLRAHGWSRNHARQAALEAENPEIDPRFLFINLGFNVRPTEVQATMGLCQLDRMPEMNRIRNRNRANLQQALERHPRWKRQLVLPAAAPGTEAIWFGFPCLLAGDLASRRSEYLAYLDRQSVENRPIVSGNFTRQPALALFGLGADPEGYPGAEKIHERGFFIGLHTNELSAGDLVWLADVLLGFHHA